MAYAEIALSQVKALRQPATPRNYEVWYTYATGYNTLLNQAINETLAHEGALTDTDLEQAISLMVKHRALEDTIQRARHYGAIAKDALALFPASPMKEALEETVEFCIARST